MWMICVCIPLPFPSHVCRQCGEYSVLHSVPFILHNCIRSLCVLDITENWLSGLHAGMNDWQENREERFAWMLLKVTSCLLLISDVVLCYIITSMHSNRRCIMKGWRTLNSHSFHYWMELLAACSKYPWQEKLTRHSNIERGP